MRRGLGFAALALAAAALVGRRLLADATLGTVGGVAVAPRLGPALTVAAIALGAYGCYALLASVLLGRTTNRRRRYNLQRVLRLAFGAAALIGAFGVVTEQWVSVLFSLGVVGVAVTFALQQPLFSLIGWVYILVKHPYGVGDRVAIEGSKGDVVSVDLFVTTLWEINGDMVSTNQPSGRVVTVPNSVVLSSHVTNFHGGDTPYVWNELSVQVAYETDLDFARERMAAVADDYLGDEMAAGVAAYRDRLGETPVELEVAQRPTVNVVQEESWVTLKLRYLVHPRRGTRVRNALSERVLAAFEEHPERVKFPLGRNR